MRLSEWRLSNDGCSFAYGGEEVETSVWDTEKAFAPKEPSPESHAVEIKKRKRGDQLLPGEVWRAKNVSAERCLSLTGSSTCTLGP